MFCVADNYDIELYNKDVKTSLLDNYGEKTDKADLLNLHIYNCHDKLQELKQQQQ